MVIGPVEVSGVAIGLYEGFRRLNVPVTLALREDHRFGYSTTQDLPAQVRRWRIAHAKWRAASGARHLARLRASLRVRWRSWAMLLHLARSHTTFFYLFGGAYTNAQLLELWLLRLLGRTVVFVNLGSDTRPPYLDGPVLDKSLTREEMFRLAIKRRALVRRQERFARIVVAAPSCGQFHTRPFMSWFAMGIPIRDSGQTPPEGAWTPRRADGRVRVLHAPSDPTVKGTPLIREIVERLQAQGLPISYRELTGTPQSEVARALSDCDLVLDQAYSDLPLPGLAAEAAALGVPTLVSGYFYDRAARAIPEELRPPSRFVHPDRLEMALLDLISDPHGREALGASAREFVHAVWDPASVARRFLHALDHGLPAAWTYDPCDLDYMLGCGASQTAITAALRSLVTGNDYRLLLLDDKPSLLAAARDLLREGAT